MLGFFFFFDVRFEFDFHEHEKLVLKQAIKTKQNPVIFFFFFVVNGLFSNR